MDSNSNEIVQFDVGGRLFKTSRSLIDKHEGTMLARLISDTWQEDPTKPVFIDRDGDIFAQVLNYLRYGSIELPINISKAMFLRYLDFYGILPVEDSVKTTEGWEKATQCMEQDLKSLVRASKKMEGDIADMKKGHVKLGDDHEQMERQLKSIKYHVLGKPLR